MSAALIVRIAETYGLFGLALAFPFLLWGIDRVAPQAVGAYAFRPLLLPGVVLLWPVIAICWLVLERRR